jgi:hypothetical protein
MRKRPQFLAANAILDAVADLRVKGTSPEDVADALLILGANAVVELMGAKRTAQLLEEMAEELRAGTH